MLAANPCANPLAPQRWWLSRRNPGSSFTLSRANKFANVATHGAALHALAPSLPHSSWSSKGEQKAKCLKMIYRGRQQDCLRQQKRLLLKIPGLYHVHS